MSLRIWQILRKTQKIVCRYIKVNAQCPDILHTGFILPQFQIGNLSLCHIQLVSQFRLVHIPFLPKKADLLPQCQFHIHHRAYFIIDANFLFTFRQ